MQLLLMKPHRLLLSRCLVENKVMNYEQTISSAKVTSAGVVTLTVAAKGKLIIDGTLDIECNY